MKKEFWSYYVTNSGLPHVVKNKILAFTDVARFDKTVRLTMAKPESNADVRLEAFSLALLR